MELVVELSTYRSWRNCSIIHLNFSCPKYWDIWDSRVAFKVNGLDLNPNTNRVKRRINGGRPVRISLYHKNRKKSRCSVPIWIWRNACFVFDINTIFLNLNLIRISKRCGRRHVQVLTVYSKMGHLCFSPKRQRPHGLFCLTFVTNNYSIW